ncbi:MAG: DNA-binding protein [Methanosarcinaceae archaeon]|nr:DNA-binding protein [Methanosarcinaceae archaeon]
MVEREISYRLFAKEFNDSTFNIHPKSEQLNQSEGRAPNFLVTPAGLMVNRLFVVGVVTEIDNIGTENDLWRARVVDPTGAFIVYAGQYQPEAAVFLSTLEVPSYVSVVGKARTFEPEDGSVFVSIRPEEMNVVDASIRDRWIVDTAELTLDRINTFSDALSSGLKGSKLNEYLIKGGAPESLAEGIVLAFDYYHTGEGYLQGLKTALRDSLKSIDLTCSGVSAFEVGNQEFILGLMEEMDVGKGVDYGKLIETARFRGMSENAVEIVVRSLLSNGQCYEPKIGILKMVS